MLPRESEASILTARELLLAFFGLLALAALIYLPHAANHGLYTDDWWFVQGFHFADNGLGSIGSMLDVSPFPGNTNDHFSLIDSYRPGQTFQLMVQYLIAGQSGTTRMVLAVPLAAIESFLLYVVMRQLGLRSAVAAVAAALLAIGTFVDSTRLWNSVQPEMNAASFYLGGLACGLAGLRSPGGRRKIAWHAAAFFLYLASVLTYEGFLILIPLTGLAYLYVGGRRAALPRWGADLLVVAFAVATVLRTADRDRGGESSISHLLDRVGDVLPAAIRVFGWSIPGESFVVGPLGIVLVLAAGAGLVLALRGGGALARASREWLLVGGVALVLALIGLIPLLPAESALTPSNGGFGNRLLVTSSIFYPLLYLSAIALIAIGLAALIRRPTWVLPLAAVGIVVLVIGMVNRELQRQDDFSAAWAQEKRIVDRIQDTLPAPKPGSTIISFRHPLVVDGGLVAFATDYDLEGALRLRYGDESILAHPFLLTGNCGVSGMDFSGTFEPLIVLPYAQMYFVDAGREKAKLVPDQAACLKIAGKIRSRPKREAISTKKGQQ